MKVRIVSMDSGTGEKYTFDTEIFCLDGDSVCAAYTENLAAQDDMVVPHTVVSFVQLGENAAFVFISNDPYFGPTLVTGLVYT